MLGDGLADRVTARRLRRYTLLTKLNIGYQDYLRMPARLAEELTMIYEMEMQKEKDRKDAALANARRKGRG